MKMFKKWKNDKKFRKNVIFGLIIFFFLTSNFAGTQIQSVDPTKEAQCNSLFEGDAVSSRELNTCEAYPGCYAQTSWNGDAPLGLDDAGICLTKFFANTVGDTVDMKCTSQVPAGKNVLNDKAGCEFYFAVETGKLCGETVYKCMDLPAGEEDDYSCSYWQEPIAEFIDGVWKNNPINSCNTKAYLAIGAIVLVFLAVI